MANSQTEALIDVSDRRTSSPDAKDKDQSLVEDSLKDNSQVYQGGAVQTPRGPFLEDEEDDLYSESPEAKSRRIAREALSKSLTLSKEASATTVEDSYSAPDARKEESRDGRSAEEQERDLSQKAPSVEQPSAAPIVNGNTPAMHGNVNQTELGRSTSQTFKEQQQSTKAHPASQSAAMPKTKANSGLSALAALRARRNGISLQDTTSAPSAAETAPVLATDRNHGETKVKGKGKEKTSEPVAQSTNRSISVENPKRPTAGRLQARKGGMFAATPLPTKRMEQSSAKANDSNATDELVKDNGPPMRNSNRLTERGTLKTPKPRELWRGSGRSSTYDLVESPESGKSVHPGRDTVASKKSTTAGQRSSVAPSASRPRTGRPTRMPGPGRPGARRSEAPREQSQPATNTRRGRMKAESNVEPTEAPETSAKTKKSKAVAETRPHQRAGSIAKASTQSTAAKGRHEGSKVHDGDSDGDVDDLISNDALQDTTEDPQPVKAPRHRAEAEAIASRNPSEDQPAKKSTSKASRVDQKIAKAQTNTQGHLTALNEQRAKTPAILGSSPPLSAAAAGLTNGLNKKPSIISFGKSGPQNQGSSSARKVDTAPTRIDRFSVPPQPNLLQSDTSGHEQLQERSKQRPSLPPPNMIRRRSGRSATQTNVADGVTDALASFRKTTGSLGISAANENKHVAQPEIDDGEFMHIDDLDDFDSTIMLAEKEGAANGSPRRVGTERTHSQREMPPPPARNTLEAKKTKTIARRQPVQHLDIGLDPDMSQIATKGVHPPLKRAHEPRDSQEPPSKRTRAARQQVPEAAKLNNIPTKPTKTLNEQHRPVFPQQNIKPTIEPVKAASQKTSRERSHGSQKVDVQGSPIPSGMILKGKDTVLEQFSQQAGLSSDNINGDHTFAIKRSTINGMKVDNRVHPLPPSSHQPERMSSNKKRRPSGPEDESRGITKAIRKDHQQPLVVDETSIPTADPFTSNSESGSRSSVNRSSSALFFQLQEQIQHETVSRLQQHASKPQISEEAIASLSRNPFKSLIRENITAVGEHNQKQYDPDKTLVECDPGLRLSTTKRAASISTVSSDSSTSSTDSPKTSGDLALWRGALEPHQMRLFDGLIIVSHKLVRHLVDQETAQNDIADDYKRRGINIIEQMELRQAKEYQDVMKRIKSTKKHFYRELIRCSKDLREQAADVEEMRGERKESYANRETLEDRLHILMAEVC